MCIEIISLCNQWLPQWSFLESGLLSQALRYILSCGGGGGVLSSSSVGPCLLSFPKAECAALREHRRLIVTGKAEAGGGSLCLRVQQWLANSSIMASQCETVQIAS